MKKHIIILLLLSSIINVNAQENNNEFIRNNFPDTIKFNFPKIDTVKTLANLKMYNLGSYAKTAKLKGEFIYKDKLAYIKDTIIKPSGYVFIDFYGVPFIALKKDDSFLIFNLLYSSSDMTIERINFNNTGNLELLIKSKNEGRSIVYDSLENEILSKDNYQYTYIFDLDKKASICIYNYFSEIEIAEKIVSFDNSVSENKEQNNIACENFAVTINPLKITLTELNTCNDFNEGIEINVLQPIKITYILTPYGLIKSK